MNVVLAILALLVFATWVTVSFGLLCAMFTALIEGSLPMAMLYCFLAVVWIGGGLAITARLYD